MARYMLHKVLIIVIFCVAVLFLSGIVLPRLFSKQYFELRSELKAHSEDFKLNYEENSNSTFATVEDIRNNSFVKSIVWKNVSTKQREKDLSTEVKSLKREENVKTRKKRQTNSDHIEKSFAWNFNFNITRYGNNTLETSHKNKNTSHNESDNYLGMAVYMQGKGPKRSYSELENAWSSVGAFIRSLFGKNVERMPLQLENEAMLSISGSLQTKSDFETTQIPSTEKFINEGSGDGSPNRNRKGRFILKFLGFGGKSLDKTTEFSKSEDISETTAPTIMLNESGINFRNDINLQNSVPEKSEMVTASNKKINFPSESLELNTEDLLGNNLMYISKFNSSKSFNEDGIQTVFETNEETVDGCFDCDNESFETTPHKESKSEIVSDKTVESNVSFTDEELEKYCMNLVNQLEESERFLSSIGSGSDLQGGNFREGNQENSVRGPEIFDLFSLFTALQQSKLNSNSSVTEDTFPADKSTVSPNTVELNINENGQSRFFDFNMFGFGSGRSAFDETSDLPSDRNSDAEEMENLPSILDCESYFRKKQNIKMFPKPNLMDIISDPNIKLADFANGSISLKLKEQQLQFLTDRLKASLNNSSLEKSEINSANELKKQSLIANDSLQESSSKINPKIEENIIEIKTIVPEFNLSEKDSVENSINADNKDVTEAQRDGRLFNFLQFGSGNGVSEDVSTEIARGFFIGSFFGSGERSIETSDSIYESSESLIENGFQDFSGDSHIDSETDERMDFTESTVGQERFWGLLGLSGSGDGRQFKGSEIETTTPFVEAECESDCSFEIHNDTNIPRDCNKCNIVSQKSSSEEVNECADNCLNYSFSNESSISESVDTPADNIDDLALIYDYQYYNCSNCSHVGHENTEENIQSDYNFENCGDCSRESVIKNSSTKNINFEECDDCNFNVEPESYGDSEDTPTVAGFVNKTSLSHSHQSKENDCKDCKDESYDKEMSYFKTDSQEIVLSDKETKKKSGFGTFTEWPNTSDGDMKTEEFGQIFDPVFLDSSGDGGLENRELTNLVEDTIPTGKVSESRLHDYTVTEIANASNEFVGRTERPAFPKKRGRLEDLEDNMTENIVDSSNKFSKETTLKEQIQFTNRRGRLEDSSLDRSHLKVKENPTLITFSASVSSTDHVTVITKTPIKNRDTDSTRLSRITTLSEIISSVSEVPATIFQHEDSEPRFCTSASECNIKLNEGCLKSPTSSVCGCRRKFVRNKETRECVAKSTVKASLKLPAEEFEDELTNQLSPRFKNMTKKASDTMLLLLSETPELIQILAGLEVTGFSPGSLIVNWNLELAASNESEVELIQSVKSGLNKALADDNLISKTPLDVRNASVLSVSSNENPCKSKEIYCSEHAHCIQTSYFPGFTCRCKDDYFDVSSNDMYPGELCEALCPSDYCGEHGHCDYSEKEGKRCLCSEWYFGDRCQIYGVLVISSFSVCLFLFMAGIVLAVVCKQRCRKSSYVAPEGFRRSEEVGMTETRQRRVSDVIAMEENVGARIGKFQQISTPVPPVIKLTKPSLNESSISFDDDSTFDRTTSVHGSGMQTPSEKSVVAPQ